MLQELEITNGILELKFDPYTYEYTVLVDKNISELEFEYAISEDCTFSVRDNNLIFNENTVYVDVYNVDDLITYKFLVYKENAKEISLIDDYIEKLELTQNNQEFELYSVQLLVVSIFIIIVLIFSILFKQKKHTI